MRRAFNMMMAIFMLVLLSGLALLTLQYTKIHATHFVDSYNKEQAELFMQSVIEATLLRIEGYDRQKEAGCVRKLDFLSPQGRFEANVTIVRYYLYDGKDNDSSPSRCPDITKKIATPESHGYVLMNVVVQSLANSKVRSPIKIVRRTLQRP